MNDRRHFVLAGLSAALAGNSGTTQAAQPQQPSYLCVYRPGAGWLPGKPQGERERDGYRAGMRASR